jgi:hypothetical protein
MESSGFHQAQLESKAPRQRASSPRLQHGQAGSQFRHLCLPLLLLCRVLLLPLLPLLVLLLEVRGQGASPAAAAGGWPQRCLEALLPRTGRVPRRYCRCCCRNGGSRRGWGPRGPIVGAAAIKVVVVLVICSRQGRCEL